MFRPAVVAAVFVLVSAASFGQDLRPSGPRQGGDTVETAAVISGPLYDGTGTTAGYHDDYDVACPDAGSTSPDVVYRISPAADGVLTVDLCGSSYDTKLYVYDEALNVVACNDDFYFDDVCGRYVSRLDAVAIEGGLTYFIVVDGYGGAGGAYHLVVGCVGCGDECPVACPADGEPEGEPPLVDGYVDDHNGGCNTPPAFPFQALVGDGAGALVLCGVSGWYHVDGGDRRDTDWYVLTMGPAGTITVAMEAERATYAYELDPGDCGSVGVLQYATIAPCDQATMTITSQAPGAPVWFWIGPTTYAAPGGGASTYDYLCTFTGLEPDVATGAITWSTIKALSR